MTTDTKKLRELHAKGTQGEWKFEPAEWEYDENMEANGYWLCPANLSAGGVHGNGEPVFRVELDDCSGLDDANAALIVAAVNALPELCDELDAVTAERDALKEALQMIREHYTSDPNALAGLIARAALKEAKGE